MAEGQREAASGGGDGKHSFRNKLKKRKKKFLANVKGFGKQGNFGRGTHLESDEWNYYINILDAMKRGFESLEDKSKCSTEFMVRFDSIQPEHDNNIVFHFLSLSLSSHNGR